MNELGGAGTPFFFLIDFEQQKPIVLPVSKVNSKIIKYDVNGKTNFRSEKLVQPPFLEPELIPLAAYRPAYNEVLENLNYGNSYLVNLTCATPVKLQGTLLDVYHSSNAKYKLYVKDQFVVFSPEIFVRIEGNSIRSFPMKGTIDANLPNAYETLLNDKKELAEHVTIVDLIRNDLSKIATNVEVPRFRYVESVKATHKSLLQVSSEIKGILADDWRENIGTIFRKLLPAGSVSGAPKSKTLEIIAKAEEKERGYYTGVFGIFDGVSVDSGVIIRYIEQKGNVYFYRSGGGITSFSLLEKEYEEMINKIYIPAVR